MRIAINTRFLLPEKLEGFGRFTLEVCKRMVNQHPEHEFIFFFDRKYDPSFIFSKNVTGVVVKPPCRHPFLFKIWFNHSVKRALKKYQADVFFSPDGYLSLTTDCPQVGVIHDINFEHYPKDLPKKDSAYLRTHFPKFAEQAAHIITVSEYSKKDIVNCYGTDPNKIEVAYNGIGDDYKILSESEQKKIRQKYTNGKPYFLFVGSLHPRKNITRLLLAYDILHKKHPESAPKLVIVGDAYWWSKSMKKSFEKLEAKNDIIFTGHLKQNELAGVMGSALSLVFVSYFEGFGIPIVEAFQAGTPVIAGNRTALPEIAGDAAYLVNPFDAKEIAFAMENVNENAQLRASLIAKGKERLKLFSWDQSAEICYAAIERVYQENRGD